MQYLFSLTLALLSIVHIIATVTIDSLSSVLKGSTQYHQKENILATIKPCYPTGTLLFNEKHLPFNYCHLLFIKPAVNTVNSSSLHTPVKATKVL